ncbi:MAG: hypothetical protein HYZ26_03540 [Chloroflexi bacterium]|nr:hypothetical protein [Chloroflexota bacterium]
MTRRKSFVVAVTIIIVFGVIGLVFSEESVEPDYIKLSISLAKYEVPIGGFPDVFIEIENVSSRTLFINSEPSLGPDPHTDVPHRSLYFYVTPPTGEFLHPICKMTYYLVPELLIPLVPGEIFRLKVNYRFCFNLDKPGRYSLQAAYGNSFSPPDMKNVWTGVVDSNTVYFFVVSEE